MEHICKHTHFIVVTIFDLYQNVSKPFHFHLDSTNVFNWLIFCSIDGLISFEPWSLIYHVLHTTIINILMQVTKLWWAHHENFVRASWFLAIWPIIFLFFSCIYIFICTFSSPMPLSSALVWHYEFLFFSSIFLCHAWCCYFVKVGRCNLLHVSIAFNEAAYVVTFSTPPSNLFFNPTSC